MYEDLYKGHEDWITNLKLWHQVESNGGVQATTGHEEAEQTGEQFLSWAPPPQYTSGHGNFGAENNHEVAAMPAPGYEDYMYGLQGS
ncbi:unnamed protein product [Urochloa humidicola]